MRMGLKSLEALALRVRQSAGIASDAVPLASEIARRTLGDNRVRHGLAGTATRYERRCIWVAEDHPEINFAVAHGLALYALITFAAYAGTPSEVDHATGILGPAICAPASATCHAHDYYGEDHLLEISSIFGLSQARMHLRLGVVLHDSRAVVTLTNRVLANDEEWRTKIPTVEIARGRTKMPGICQAPFRDGRSVDRGSVGLWHVS